MARETLVAHARAAFGEAGYPGASMDTIARRAGLKKSSLFHHFATKDDLYLAVFADIMAELGTYIDDARVGQGDFASRLDQLSSLMTQYLALHPEVAGLVLRELIDEGPFMKGIGRSIVEGVLSLVERLLADGMASGDIPRADPKHLALSIAGLHMSYFAAARASALLVGGSVFATEHVEARAREVALQVRRMCGLPGR